MVETVVEARMSQHYDQLVERLIQLVAPGFGGQTRPELVDQVSHLTREIELAGHQDPIIRKTTASIREWVGIACSVRLHKELGLSKVEANALADAESLRGKAPPAP